MFKVNNKDTRYNVTVVYSDVDTMSFWYFERKLSFLKTMLSRKEDTLVS